MTPENNDDTPKGDSPFSDSKELIQDIFRKGLELLEKEEVGKKPTRESEAPHTARKEKDSTEKHAGTSEKKTKPTKNGSLRAKEDESDSGVVILAEPRDSVEVIFDGQQADFSSVSPKKPSAGKREPGAAKQPASLSRTQEDEIREDENEKYKVPGVLLEQVAPGDQDNKSLSEVKSGEAVEVRKFESKGKGKSAKILKLGMAFAVFVFLAMVFANYLNLSEHFRPKNTDQAPTRKRAERYDIREHPPTEGKQIGIPKDARLSQVEPQRTSESSEGVQKPGVSEDVKAEPIDIPEGEPAHGGGEHGRDEKVSGLTVTNKTEEGSVRDTVGDTENPISYPYSILLASYSSLENAKKALLEYEEKDLPAYYVKTDIGAKGVWFRVFTGHFRHKQEAEVFMAKRNLADAILKHTKYAVGVNTDEGEDGFKEKISALRALGYSPYVIEGVGGRTRLYVGAFAKKEDAENLQLELKTKAIQSRCVER